MSLGSGFVESLIIGLSFGLSLSRASLSITKAAELESCSSFCVCFPQRVKNPLLSEVIFFPHGVSFKDVPCIHLLFLFQ